jgi:hypothetical protein
MKILLTLLILSTLSFAEDLTTKGQVDLVGPVGVDIRTGWSSWSAKLPQPIQVNPIQVLFWNNNRRCNQIPVTSVSVKYVNDVYWYSATPKDGAYYVESRFLIEGVKLDFYQEGVEEFCVIKISGIRDIAEP